MTCTCLGGIFVGEKSDEEKKMYPMKRKKLDNLTHNDLHMSHVNVIFLIFKKLSEKSLRAEEFCYKNTEMVAILTISVLKRPEDLQLY